MEGACRVCCSINPYKLKKSKSMVANGTGDESTLVDQEGVLQFSGQTGA